MVLLLAGDVEQNPGPSEHCELGTLTDSCECSSVLRFGQGKLQLLTALQVMQQWQQTVECKMTRLAKRVTCLEQRRLLSTDNVIGMCEDIAALKAAADDAENRLRRNNLFFRLARQQIGNVGSMARRCAICGY